MREGRACQANSPRIRWEIFMGRQTSGSPAPWTSGSRLTSPLNSQAFWQTQATQVSSSRQVVEICRIIIRTNRGSPARSRRLTSLDLRRSPISRGRTKRLLITGHLVLKINLSAMSWGTWKRKVTRICGMLPLNKWTLRILHRLSVSCLKICWSSRIQLWY